MYIYINKITKQSKQKERKGTIKGSKEKKQAKGKGRQGTKEKERPKTRQRKRERERKAKETETQTKHTDKTHRQKRAKGINKASGRGACSNV